MRRIRGAAALAILVLAMRPAVAVAAAPDVGALRARIAAILAREAVPGAGLAVVRRGEPVWAGGVGLADARSGRPVGPDTPFRVGSISKSVTALALVRLAESGAVSLDARLAEVAPEVPFENAWEREHPVRLAHLLEHTAGFEFLRFNEWFEEGAPRPLLEALRVNPRSRVSRWPPGTRPCYSNEGYLAAGYVLERVTGRPFDVAVRRLVLEPLGMEDAAFALTPSLARRLAQGYRRGAPVAYEEDLMRPAANLIASARDLGRYLALWVGRGEVDGRRLLSAEGVRRVEGRRTLPWGGPDDAYGLGNAGAERDGRVARGHEGWTFGFTAAFHYLPAEGVGWAVLLNRDEAGAAVEEVEAELEAFALRGAPPPSPPEAGPLPADVAGFYADAAPPEELLRPLTSLGGLEIAERDGGLAARDLRVGGLGSLLPRGRWTRLLPSAAGGLRREGEAGSTLQLVRGPSGAPALLLGAGYLERVPAWRIALARALLGAALLVMLSALAAGPAAALAPWARGAAGAPAWAWLALAVPGAAAACAWALLRWSPQLLGRPDATSIALWGLSWAFAVGVAAAALGALALATRPGALAARGYALAVATACVGLAAFAARAGWIGLRTWRW